MLANDGATVYSIDIDSIYVMERGRMTRTDVTPDDAIKAADVVVLGVPSPQYKLPVATLKKGAVVVNVSGFKNLGDAQEGDDADYTYIPLVGRVTAKAHRPERVFTLRREPLGAHADDPETAEAVDGATRELTDAALRAAGVDPAQQAPAVVVDRVTLGTVGPQDFRVVLETARRQKPHVASRFETVDGPDGIALDDVHELAVARASRHGSLSQPAKLSTAASAHRFPAHREFAIICSSRPAHHGGCRRHALRL